MKLRALSLMVACGSLVVLSGCFGGDDHETNDPARVDTGDTVTVEYTVIRSDDNVFATTVSGTETTALSTRILDNAIQETFVAGDEKVLRGADVIGLAVGDSLEKTIDPSTSGEEQYYDRNKIQNMNATAFGAGVNPTVGDVYDIGGQQAYISGLSGEGSQQQITFDLNPRQTWDSYSYSLTVRDIQNK